VKREDGFTLVELLVTMVVTTIVFGATVAALANFQHANKADTLRNEVQDRARNTLDRLARGLRNVTARTSTSPGALEQASAYSIAFDTVDPFKVAGGENKSNEVRVRYCLNDSNSENEIVYRQEQRWTTAEPPTLPGSTECPDLSAGDWETTSKAATNATNRIGGQDRALFTYATTETPQIVTVEANLYLDLAPGKKPGETQLTTAVSLRNANRPPIVSFTPTQKGLRVLLNASESRDPEGLALTYKWLENSKTLPSTAEFYETGELEKGATYTFTLEVTDPSGLKSSTSQAVTIL
jgi:prepilin-type N-terminal cleavage/methylation domain-containing protein